jgi:LEA14-like dessication related protein
MTQHSLVRILVGCCLVLVLTGCLHTQALEYRDIENFKISKLSMGESVVSADLKYMNPNNFGLRLKHAEVDIYINNRYMGRSVLDTLINIPKRDSFLVPVSMKVKMGDILANAIDVLLLKEADIKLEGSAKLGKGGIYKNVPIKYEGKQQLNMY